MHKILIPERDLQRRVNSIRNLLKPISKNKNTGPSVNFLNPPSIRRTTKYIGANDGTYNPDDIRQWRFSTHKKEFNGNYFELWCKSPENNEDWYLFQSYLHIYQKDTNQAVLAFHVDPNEALGANHCDYKRSPHFHLSYPDTYFPDAHIALNKLDLDWILESLSSLEIALDSGIKMIVEQMIK